MSLHVVTTMAVSPFRTKQFFWTNHHLKTFIIHTIYWNMSAVTYYFLTSSVPFLEIKHCILIKISLKCVHNGLIDTVMTLLGSCMLHIGDQHLGFWDWRINYWYTPVIRQTSWNFSHFTGPKMHFWQLSRHDYTNKCYQSSHIIH